MGMMGRLDPLTGWRGIAAYSVLTAHAIDISFYYSGNPIFHPFASRIADFGMSVFFVLSGFVIQYNYSSLFSYDGLGAATYKFFVARFARLYPLYAISIVVTLPHIPAPNFGNIWVLIAYLTLTQSWFNVEMATFLPDWSISTEWFFYFAFVPLTFLITKISRPILTLLLFSSGAMIGLAAIFHFFQGPLTSFVERWFWLNEKVSDGAWLWVSYYSPYVRLIEFICGMLAAKTYSVIGPRARPSMRASMVIALALLWVGVILFFGRLTHNPLISDILPNVIFAPALAALILCSCLYKTALSRTLSSPLLLFAGEISYSVYIWSWSVMTLLSGYLVSPSPSPIAYANSTLKLVAQVAVTTIFAYGSYLLIETPSRRWLRKVLTPRSLKSRGLAAQVGD
jgi:peptidoglycan/LPS O-acetylase OafA/YrhL